VLDNLAQGDEPDGFTPPKWHTDPKATTLPLGYERDDSTEPATHRLTLGEPSEPRPVVKSALSPAELPREQLIALAAGSFEAATRAKCSRIMAETIAKGWLACYHRAMN
jgi:hypothetical protein